MEERTVERFKVRTCVFHWIHTTAFLVLIITGAIILFPGIGGLAAGGATRVIHRIFAVIFVVGPFIYFPFNPKESLHFIKESLIGYGREDIGWMKASADYYFGGDEDKMPPQGHSNTGQKMWQTVCLLTGVLFTVSGVILWFYRGDVSTEVFQGAMIIHTLAFTLALVMLCVHIYLGAIHPRMTESFKSIIDGKISPHYAKHHYGKWYDEITSDNKKH